MIRSISFWAVSFFFLSYLSLFLSFFSKVLAPKYRSKKNKHSSLQLNEQTIFTCNQQLCTSFQTQHKYLRTHTHTHKICSIFIETSNYKLKTYKRDQIDHIYKQNSFHNELTSFIRNIIIIINFNYYTFI